MCLVPVVADACIDDQGHVQGLAGTDGGFHNCLHNGDGVVNLALGCFEQQFIVYLQQHHRVEFGRR